MHDSTPFHLPSILSDRAKAARGKPKRVRTRLSLIAATAVVMEQHGYEGTTVEAITTEAGVARGTFYIYFKNRSDAALAVRRAYSAMIRTRMPKRLGNQSPFRKMLLVNHFYCNSYATNARLLAGHEALIRERPELGRTRDFLNDRWARALTQRLRGRMNLSLISKGQKGDLLAARMVISMADEVLREVFIYKGPKLVELTDDPLAIAEMLSVMWHRSLFACDPSKEDLQFSKTLAKRAKEREVA